MSEILRKSITILVVVATMLILTFSRRQTADDTQLSDCSRIVYSEEFSVLYLLNCNQPEIPDSIASKNIRVLSIYSSEAIDFEFLSKQINLTQIISLWIDSLNQHEINLDLARLPNLRTLGIQGCDNVQKINL